MLGYNIYTENHIYGGFLVENYYIYVLIREANLCNKHPHREQGVFI